MLVTSAEGTKLWSKVIQICHVTTFIINRKTYDGGNDDNIVNKLRSAANINLSREDCKRSNNTAD